MTFKQTAVRAAAALALGAALIPAHATNGYFSHGYGIKAKGMGGAGVALAQDGFAGANNPAQSAFAGNRYDVGVDLFMPEREMSRTGNGMDVSSQSGAKSFLIPELGYNRSISKDLSMGLTIYGNGGMNTSYPATVSQCPDGNNGLVSGGNVLCGQGELGVDLMQLIVAPTFAFKLNEEHAIGVSPLFVYQTFKAEGLHMFTQGQTSSDPSKLTNQGRDSSTGLGVRLGYMGNINDKVSLGVSYAPKIDMSRFKKYQGLFAEQGDFDIPANYTVGLAFKATPSLLLAMDYQFIEYSGVKAISNPMASPGQLGADNGMGFGWSDIGVIKLGVQWQANEAWTLRAGYNKGENPVKAANVTFNILAPGVVEEHITLGATMKLDSASEVSASYMHAFANSVTGASFFNAPGGTAVQETIKMKQNSLGIQYSRKF
jgi:long-chain fatty acid transport protein